MSSDERGALIAAWWEHHRLSTGTRGERKPLADGRPADAVAAWETVDELVRHGAPGVVRLLAGLDAAAPGDDGQAVGAGPLEDLVREHGDEMIDEIDDLARRSATFRRALSRVWLEPGTLSPETEARLERWVVPR